jgi:predicted lipoprotein with Yx(FWY)xxD motif
MNRKSRERLVCTASVLLLICHGPSARAFDIALPYPAEVSLSQDGDKGFVYRSCPGSQRLYTYDLDHDGRSFCNAACADAWPPVIAPASARALGQWSVIRREDGRLQWAYRGHPVYSLLNDAPNHPKGDGKGGVWHLLPYEK